jgi:hypothetical protein
MSRLWLQYIHINMDQVSVGGIISDVFDLSAQQERRPINCLTRSQPCICLAWGLPAWRVSGTGGVGFWVCHARGCNNGKHIKLIQQSNLDGQGPMLYVQKE